MEKSRQLTIKLLIATALVTVFTFFTAVPNVSFAETNNIFVEDYAGILSEQDKSYIKNINEQEFSQLDGQPQYAVVTLKNLDGYDSIEDYAEEKFQKLGIGNKDLDNGFLFVISIEDRAYRLETGYGVEDVITDSMKEDVVTEAATSLLKSEDYAGAVMLISKNVEKLVNEKYGDVEAAKELIAKEKEQQAKFVRMVITVIFIAIGVVLIAIFIYRLGIAKLRKTLNKKFVSKNVMGLVYSDSKNQLTGTAKGMKQVNLSQHFAEVLYKSSKKAKLLADDQEMKQWMGQYLLIDGIMQYWKQAKKEAPYEVSVYLEDKYLHQFRQEMLPKSQTFTYPIEKNPYLLGDEIGLIGQYISLTSQKHKEALRISKENKQFIERVSEQYLDQHRIRLRKIDFDLEVALMVYYFLREKDLSDPNLLRDIDINEQTLTKAYRFAEKRRRQISSDQKKKALNDLTNMTLGSYYMQAMIWSSYSSSSSSSIGGGGGSSFGGGSSGGGGFSGGW